MSGADGRPITDELVCLSKQSICSRSRKTWCSRRTLSDTQGLSHLSSGRLEGLLRRSSKRSLPLRKG